MRCGLVVKYKLVRKYHAHLSHIPHCSYDVFSTIKRVTSCSSVYCNISSHTVVVIELAWWQGPLYIIGGGTVRYSSAKQRTFGCEIAKMCKQLHVSASLATPDQYLSQHKTCANNAVRSGEFDVGNTSCGCSPQAYFRLYSCSAVLQWTIYNRLCLFSACAIEWIGAWSVWCTRRVSIEFQYQQLFARTCVWKYSLGSVEE